VVLFIVCNQRLESNYKLFHWVFPLKNHILLNKIKALRFWMRTSYVVEADTATTAIVNLIGKIYTAAGTLSATEQDRYRIAATGALVPVSADILYSTGTHLVFTYN